MCSFFWNILIVEVRSLWNSFEEAFVCWPVAIETIFSGKELLVGICRFTEWWVFVSLVDWKSITNIGFEGARTGYLTYIYVVVILSSFCKCDLSSDVLKSCSFRFVKGNSTAPPVAGLALHHWISLVYLVCILLSFLIYVPFFFYFFGQMVEILKQ